MTRIRTIAAFIAAGVAFATAQQAQASGFALRESSADGMGTAFAGNASSGDFLSTVFNNPAGMTNFTGTRVQAGASGIFFSSQFSGSATERGCGMCGPFAFPISGENSIDPGEPAAVPFLYGLYSISPDLKVGLAVTAPFGLSTEYSNTWVGRYFGITSKLTSTDINPNVAYRINDWLSIGGGISAQYFSATLTNAIDQNAIAGLPPGGLQTIPGACSNANCDAFLRVNGDNWGVGYNGGIMLQPTPDTNIGMTYRSRVRHDITGTASFTGASPVLTANPLLAAALSTSAFSAGLVTPASADFSITQKITDQFHLSADVQWTGWSVFNTLGILRTSGPLANTNLMAPTPENWHDTVFVALGGTYAIDDAWTVRGGVAWDQTPIPSSNVTVRLPDNSRYWLAMGFGYKFSEGTSVDFAYAHLFVPNTSLNSSVNSVLLPVTPGGGIDTISGTYSSHIDLISAQARFKF